MKKPKMDHVQIDRPIWLPEDLQLAKDARLEAAIRDGKFPKIEPTSASDWQEPSKPPKRPKLELVATGKWHPLVQKMTLLSHQHLFGSAKA
jgi:hypothetical protein